MPALLISENEIKVELEKMDLEPRENEREAEEGSTAIAYDKKGQIDSEINEKRDRETNSKSIRTSKTLSAQTSEQPPIQSLIPSHGITPTPLETNDTARSNGISPPSPLETLPPLPRTLPPPATVTADAISPVFTGNRNADENSPLLANSNINGTVKTDSR